MKAVSGSALLGLYAAMNAQGMGRSRPPIHIFVPVYMMCAFGVPGNMIQGDVRLGFAEIPVVCGVAKGMYVTYSEVPPLAFAVTESKLPPNIW